MSYVFGFVHTLAYILGLDIYIYITLLPPSNEYDLH